MGRTKYFTVLFVLFFLIAPGLKNTSYGQMENEGHPGSWTVISGNADLHEDWSIPLVCLMKHNDVLDQYGFSFVRTGVTRQLSRSSKLTAGISFFNSSVYGENESIKNSSQLWFYGEYVFNLNLRKDVLAQRFRWENRRTLNSEDANHNNRIRYRLQYIKPISSNIYIRSFNELFLIVEGSSFDQNRFYIGVGQRLTKSLKLDLGYMKRHLKASSEDMIRMELTFSLDLTKNDLAQHSQ
ncbi:DUF2490 domain-containing protein [Flagellimonas nanhaiensis]|uniref:DUF2490 domain-containing protein n=1 Tax=Flagellimonas nanhaiensis TaxID=2292706 RepID=A0A371JN54_9FLAO|nr:DUF2490 domain-containing protein [Allomuricauda nanhaiensis]RDY58671.1 DUF2490 domain-containing protein [Allomuricauda nanhaiensis]